MHELLLMFVVPGRRADRHDRQLDVDLAGLLEHQGDRHLFALLKGAFSPIIIR